MTPIRLTQGLIDGNCISFDPSKNEEYQSTLVKLKCNSNGQLEFNNSSDSDLCSSFSSNNDSYDEITCETLGFASNSGTVRRDNLSHFSYDNGNGKVELFFEQANPPGANQLGFQDISLIDSNNIDIINNNEILKNPLAMYYATCKSKTGTNPQANTICAWEKPGDPECYGKFSAENWSTNIDTPVSLGPLENLTPGYTGTLSMNSLEDYDSSSPQENIPTYILETTINNGNSLFDFAPPRRTSAYYFHPDFDISNVDGNSKLSMNIFDDVYSSTLGLTADTTAPPTTLSFQEVYKYSHKAAMDEYVNNIFEKTTSNGPFIYSQKYSFKRRFNGHLSLPQYNKFSLGDSDIEKALWRRRV